MRFGVPSVETLRAFVGVIFKQFDGSLSQSVENYPRCCWDVAAGICTSILYYLTRVSDEPWELFCRSPKVFCAGSPVVCDQRQWASYFCIPAGVLLGGGRGPPPWLQW